MNVLGATFNWLKANRHRRTRAQAPVRRVYLSWSRVVGTAVCVSMTRVFIPFSIYTIVIGTRSAPSTGRSAY